jgi:membrane-associated protease RseP (regulator of RpoE activity)
VYEWLERFQSFMDRNSLGLLVGIALAMAGTPVLVFVHELGHALAVKLRGLPLRHLKVGRETDVIVVVGGFRMELGRLAGEGDVGGYVRWDGSRATPLDVLVIALAGPLANLAGALLTGWLALRYLGATAWIPSTLALLTFGGVGMAIVNLRATGAAADPTIWSDGLWVRVAWRDRHHRGPLWRDPNEATSIEPPATAAG